MLFAYKAIMMCAVVFGVFISSSLGEEKPNIRIYRRLVLVIFAAQSLLASWEAWIDIDAHRTGGESWPGFLMFAVNFPASLLATYLIALLDPSLTFYPSLITSFALYILVGTLWWSFLAHLLRWFYSWIMRRKRTGATTNI